nr:hypothetical protein [uncultured Acinetobacter sp.]
MNIEELRKEFESSPEIKEALSDLTYFADINQYGFYGSETKCNPYRWVNGAWWQFQQMHKKLEGCVVVPETLSLDLARKRAEYIYQGAKNYLAREYANLSAIEMQLFKERWIESKAVSLQTDYLLTLESARGGK